MTRQVMELKHFISAPQWEVHYSSDRFFYFVLLSLTSLIFFLFFVFFYMVPTDPGNVTIIDVQTKDKSALVSWNMSQEACSGVVVNYMIFYGTPNGPQFSKSTTDRSLQNG